MKQLLKSKQRAHATAPSAAFHELCINTLKVHPRRAFLQSR